MSGCHTRRDYLDYLFQTGGGKESESRALDTVQIASLLNDSRFFLVTEEHATAVSVV